MKNRLRLVRVVPGQHGGYVTFTFTDLTSPNLQFAELKVRRNDSVLAFDGDKFTLDTQLHAAVREYQQLQVKAKEIERLLWKFIRTAQEAKKNPPFVAHYGGDSSIGFDAAEFHIYVCTIGFHWVAVVWRKDDMDDTLHDDFVCSDALQETLTRADKGIEPLTQEFADRFAAEVRVALKGDEQ